MSLWAQLREVSRDLWRILARKPWLGFLPITLVARLAQNDDPPWWAALR